MNPVELVASATLCAFLGFFAGPWWLVPAGILALAWAVQSTRWALS
jgi:hypothetical protein